MSNQATCCARTRRTMSRSARRPDQVPELDTRAGLGGGGLPAREVRKDGRHADPLKGEGWLFPASFVRDQLHTSPGRLLVLDTTGDSMAPTIVSGERVIVDTGHNTPTPDGLYAIRDTFECIVVKRLQVLRAARPTRVKVISDNPNHPSEETPLGELEIVGKVFAASNCFEAAPSRLNRIASKHSSGAPPARRDRRSSVSATVTDIGNQRLTIVSVLVTCPAPHFSHGRGPMPLAGQWHDTARQAAP